MKSSINHRYELNNFFYLIKGIKWFSVFTVVFSCTDNSVFLKEKKNGSKAIFFLTFLIDLRDIPF